MSEMHHDGITNDRGWKRDGMILETISMRITGHINLKSQIIFLDVWNQIWRGSVILVGNIAMDLNFISGGWERHHLASLYTL